MRLEDILQGEAERQEGGEVPLNPNRAVVTIKGEEAEIVARSLSPEAGRDIPGTSINVESVPGEATITIEAGDVAGIRAALNSYLRWADVAAKVAKEVRG